MRCSLKVFAFAIAISINTGCKTEISDCNDSDCGTPGTPSPAPLPLNPNFPPSAKVYYSTFGTYQILSLSYFTLSDTQSLIGTYFKNDQYYFLIEDTSNPQIAKFNLVSYSSSFQNPISICTILNDGDFGGGLSVTDQYFYIQNVNYSNVKFRKFSLSTCFEQSLFITNKYDNSFYRRFFFDVNGSDLNWVNGSSIYHYLVPNAAPLETLGDVRLGTKTTNFAHILGFAKKNSTIWSVSGTTLWVTNFQTQYASWSELPTSDFSSLDSIEFITNGTGNLITVFANVNYSHPHQYAVFQIDTSHF